MANDFTPARGNVAGLSRDEHILVEEKIIPTAQRWLRDHATGTPLWEHARQTLTYWGRYSEAGK